MRRIVVTATAAVLAVALGAAGAVGALKFSDIPDGHWAAEAVEWATGQGIISGKGDGTFDPDGPLTRAQMIAILHRYHETYGTRQTPIPHTHPAAAHTHDDIPRHSHSTYHHCTTGARFTYANLNTSNPFPWDGASDHFHSIRIADGAGRSLSEALYVQCEHT